MVVVLLVEPVELLLLKLAGKVLRHCSERLLSFVREKGILSGLGERIFAGGELAEGRLSLVLVERIGEDLAAADVRAATDQVDDVGSSEMLLEKRGLDGLADERLVALEGLVFEAGFVAGLRMEVVVGVDFEVFDVESRLEDDLGLGWLVFLDEGEADVVVVVVVFLLFGAFVADDVLDLGRKLGVDL